MRKVLILLGAMIIISSGISARKFSVTNYTPFTLEVVGRRGRGDKTGMIAPGSKEEFDSKWKWNKLTITKASYGNNSATPNWVWEKSWDNSKDIYIFCTFTEDNWMNPDYAKFGAFVMDYGKTVRMKKP